MVSFFTSGPAKDTSYNQTASANSSATPPKYQGGKINPDWVKWKEAQNRASGSNAPATTIPPMSPPVICNMDEKMALEAGLKREIALTPQMNETFEQIQAPSYASHVGLESDEMVDELGKVMAKYEIPMGLMSKLVQLSSFDLIEFIIDDSGSMTWDSDTTDERGRTRSRKDEALARVLEMVEVICHIKAPKIQFRFLNYNNSNACCELVRKGERPADFFMRSKCEIEKVWKASDWDSGTPMKETLEKSIQDNKGKRTVRYVFGDGVPNGGSTAVDQMEQMLLNRKGSEDHPVTFMSCTNRDSDVEWMKLLEEKAKHCSESDDFNDETEEVRKDQGLGLPYTKGFYIACELVAALNPNDLDCMDESIPFSKQDFDLLLGYVTAEEGYKSYFDGFLKAQSQRSSRTAEDKVKTSMDWKKLYQDLCRTPHALDLDAVKDYRKRLKHS